MNLHLQKDAPRQCMLEKEPLQQGNLKFQDLRPEAIAQRMTQKQANSSPQTNALKSVQSAANAFAQHKDGPSEIKASKANATGLPDRLKAGVEQLSGMSLDDVRVHYNSEKPFKIGAHAFAKGRDIFVGPSQDHHLPHELWHVVQQAQGRVRATQQLPDGSLANDDAGLEAEAETMGRKAMELQTAAPTLAAHKPIPQGNVSQCYRIENDVNGFFMAQEERQTDEGMTYMSNHEGEANIQVNDQARLRVADTGHLAIEDTQGREAKMFYATAAIVKQSNAMFREQGSHIRFGKNPDMEITVHDSSGREHRLIAVYPIDISDEKAGHKVTVPENCNEAAPNILNYASTYIHPVLADPKFQELVEGQTVGSMLWGSMGYLLKKEIMRDIKSKMPKLIKHRIIMDLLSGIVSPIYQTDHAWNVELYEILKNEADEKESRQFYPLAGQFNRGGLDSLKAYGDLTKTLDGQMRIRRAGINEWAHPKLGEMITIQSNADKDKRDERFENGKRYIMDQSRGEEIENPFPYHFAAVVAQSGTDYITMENYARRDGRELADRDPRVFFKMFGSQGQSFHEEHKNNYPNPMTMVCNNAQCEDRNPLSKEAEAKTIRRIQRAYNARLENF